MAHAAYGQDAGRDAPPVAAAGLPAAEADDADWEYEYSTTETETHLITLDLSLPEFVRRRKEHIMHNTRGGFRSWMNPIMNNDDSPPPLARVAAPLPSADTGGAGGEEDGEGEDGQTVRREHDHDHDHDHDDPMEDRPGPDAEDKPGVADAGEGDDPVPSEIQILDLHSAQPLLAYRGVVLTGAWTEVIGTELVFAEGGSGGGGGGAEGDDADGDGDGDGDGVSAPLPVAAHAVADGVALLGAATARIQCTPAALRPRARAQATPATPARAEESTAAADAAADAARKRRVGFSIPVATNASAQRQKQAAFLEQLMAAKHRLGEQDVVTVQALETPHDAVPAGDAEEAQRRARRQVQAARDHRRVLARREREREQRDRRERQARQQQAVRAEGPPDTEETAEPEPEPEPAPAPASSSPTGRRKRGRTAVDGVAGDGGDPGPRHEGQG